MNYGDSPRFSTLNIWEVLKRLKILKQAGFLHLTYWNLRESMITLSWAGTILWVLVVHYPFYGAFKNALLKNKKGSEPSCSSTALSRKLDTAKSLLFSKLFRCADLSTNSTKSWLYSRCELGTVVKAPSRPSTKKCDQRSMSSRLVTSTGNKVERSERNQSDDYFKNWHFSK